MQRRTQLFIIFGIDGGRGWNVNAKQNQNMEKESEAIKPNFIWRGFWLMSFCRQTWNQCLCVIWFMAFQLCASRHFKSNIGPTDNLSFSGVHSQSECVCVLILSHTSFSFENGAPRFRHSIGMTQKSRFLFTTESSGEIAKPAELIAPAMSSYFSHDARTVRHMIWAVDIEHSEHSAQKKRVLTRAFYCSLSHGSAELSLPRNENHCIHANFRLNIQIGTSPR